MPSAATVLRVFVSSPSDVQAQRELLDEVVERINRTDGERFGVELKLVKWEQMTPKIGGRSAQKEIDQQTPDYDIFVGIMSARFGAPTEGSDSGTDHEFEAALNRFGKEERPWILFYFNEAPPTAMTLAANEQYHKVLQFKERIAKLGSYCTYNDGAGSQNTFFKAVDEHLRRIVAEMALPVTASSAGSPQRQSAAEAALPSVAYYLNRLANDTATLTLLGMGRSLQVELPIAEAYVPLRTTLTRSLQQHTIDKFSEGHAGHHEDIDLSEVFRTAVGFDNRGVILLGEPGSGKTTGARQIAWRLASGHSRPEDLGLPGGITPVLLRFRNLSGAALEQRNGLRNFLEEETDCPEAPDHCRSPGKDLWNGRAGALLWILDGLDEVVDPNARKKVSGWIQRAIKNRLDDWFLVTCRFAGYFRKGVPLGAKFVEFHVCPLDERQVDCFVRDWFAAAHRALHDPGPLVEERAAADSRSLLNILAGPAYRNSRASPGAGASDVRSV